MIGNNGILRKRTRIAIVNEYSLVECMDRIILMRNRDIHPDDDLAPLPYIKGPFTNDVRKRRVTQILTKGREVA